MASEEMSFENVDRRTMDGQRIPSYTTLLKRIKGTQYYFTYIAVLTTQSVIPNL